MQGGGKKTTEERNCAIKERGYAIKERGCAIKDWAKDDQPREKLLSKGPHCLSDSELLAILIRTGKPDQSAVDLGKIVLKNSRDNLLELGKCTVADLKKIPGIKEAKAISIVAALELGRRRQSALPPERLEINNSKEAAAFLRPLLMDRRQEVFGVLYLTQSGSILQFQIVSEGGITSTTVDPRIIFRKAIELDAVSIIACHNHPSGSLKPSLADQALTEKLLEGSLYMGIRLLDHLIVGDHGYYSFADDGQLSKAS